MTAINVFIGMIGRVGTSYVALQFILFGLFIVPGVQAEEANFLYRIDARQHSGFTRLAFKMERHPDYELSFLPGNRVRVTLRQTDGTLRRRLRSYTDAHVGGLSFAKRDGSFLVTVAVKGDPRGVQAVVAPSTNVLVLDIGPGLAPRKAPSFVAGRERIWNGAEQLVKKFDPPLKSEIPFVPTDRRALLKAVPAEEAEQFLAGEAALYQGNGVEAEELFTHLAGKASPLRALALFRLGEARYMLQKYGEALKEFREAEKLWPQFLTLSPATTLYYADSIVRSGDLAGGRRLLAGLIAGLADKKYAPVLLVRLADILARQGREMEAVAIYRTVAENFAGNKAVYQARMKLADRRLFSLEPVTHRALLQEYMEIVAAGDFSLREEALFKATLLSSLYGEAGEAFAMVTAYEKKFPRGVYASVARGMREDLLVPVFRGIVASKDHEGLIKLATDNKEYLARCAAEADFVKELSAVFTALERERDEATLFGYIVEKEWAASQAPQLYQRLIADAEKLADLPLLEKSLGGFLRRFPTHPWALGMREQLAALEYQRGDMPAVVSRLSWLLAAKTRPDFAESLYYLGKGLERAGNLKDAERAMNLFLAEIRFRKDDSELVADAHYVCASARLARGDRKGALALLRAGSESAGPGARDQFLYKMAELARQDGRQGEAAQFLQTIVKEGKDPVWKQMATQALADIELRKKLAGKVRLSN